MILRIVVFLLVILTVVPKPLLGQIDIHASLSPQLEAVGLHEPIVLLFTLANPSNEYLGFDLGLNRVGVFAFQIAHPNGSVLTVPPIRQDGFGASGRILLRPGEVFSAHLLLNRWYGISTPGDYQVTIIVDTTFHVSSGRQASLKPIAPVMVKVLNRNVDTLVRVCNDLVQTALYGNSVEVRSEAALALSYVDDPAAIPFLQQLLFKGQFAQHYAIDGLSRIADKSAIDVLIAGLDLADSETKSFIVFTLKRLERNITDQALAKHIAESLHY